MGITGLIPFLEKASKKGNISQFSGCTVAVDTYCWLHKGAFSCAEKIAMGQPTDQYVTYCLKFVNMLLANRIKPILVFDGSHLPAKLETEGKRRESREQNKRRAAELIKMGRTAEGRQLLRRSVDITHDMALQLMKKCHEMNVDCIVAPYEADAQLAYLNISGIADVVITEDSDLTLFGCKKIFFKMDLYGNGLLVEQGKLHIAMKLREDVFSMDKFRHMCILSGCDYLPSLHGIGLMKACKFVQMNGDPEIHKALCRLGSYLNMKSVVVTDEYRDAFIRALITFKHQLVFCPLKRKQVRLQPPPSNVTSEQLYHAGNEKPDDLAWQLALGNYDPITLEKMHDFDPDIHLADNRKNRNSWDNQHVAEHTSIWSKNYKLQKQQEKVKVKDTEKTTWPNTAGKIMVLNTEILKKKSSPVKRTYEDMEDDLSDKDIVKMYSEVEPQHNKSIDSENKFTESKDVKPRKMEEDPEILTPPENKQNPFLKKSKSETSPCLIRGQNRRKPRTFIALEPTVIDETTIVKSKYFLRDTIDVTKEQTNQQGVTIPETQDVNLPLTQPDEYKENDGNNILNHFDDDLICRSDSGVDMKDDNDEKFNNIKDTVEVEESKKTCASITECESSSQNDDVIVLDNLMDDNCDISSSQDKLERSPNNTADYAVEVCTLKTVKNSFFKWSNPKHMSNDDSISSSSISMRNSKQLQTQNKPTTKLQPKRNVKVASQNLLNTYGFQKKTVLKH